MKKVYTLKGLDCANCAAKIEEGIKKIDGVEKAVVDFLKLKLILVIDETQEEKILKQVRMTIHELEPEVSMQEEVQEEYLTENLIPFLLGLIVFIIAICLSKSWKTASMILYVISYLIVGSEVVIKAIQNIFKKEFFDENFLMSVATIGAFLIGEYPEAVAVMLFYQLGEFFQKYAVNRSRKSISNLMNLRADYANVEKDGKITQISPAEVKVGDIILVQPGEKIPLDGVIVEGNSFLDTLALTGESVPRKVEKGDSILSGCVNRDAVLKVEVRSLLAESTVSKILDLVENASSNKTQSENFITKFAKYYTPIVVVLALLLAILPPLFIPEASTSVWIYRALSFLVVSCPCALVISIPLNFFGGIGAAAKRGILMKGSNYLEALSSLEMVVFDKTGTLTEGVFEVQTIHSVDMDKEKLLEIVAHAEGYSTHPIAKSIQNAYDHPIDHTLIQKVKELSGMGIVAKIDGKEVLVGNQKLMTKKKISIQICNEVGTVLYVAIDQKYAGFIVIADKLKEDTLIAIKQLKKLGIEKMGMLTGDRKEIAEAVAQKLEIDTVFAELLPNEKVEKMQEILNQQTGNKKVAFVGDGMNDAPVLALADIGIAMGGLGSDAAIEAADMVIMTDEPTKIAEGIRLSKQTLHIVKQNIYFAITVKVLVLLLSALGIATMWGAVFADVGVSVLAILNALRLLRK